MRTEYLLEREVEGILDLLTYENRLVMRTLLHTGLRIGDVLQLRPAQLKHNFWVTEQKTGKRKQVGLPEQLLSDLLDSSGEWWVFPGADPRKHRTRQAVWKDVKRAASAMRLTANAAPHSARKVYAVKLRAKKGLTSGPGKCRIVTRGGGFASQTKQKHNFVGRVGPYAFAGEPPLLFFASQLTQQNKNFVAFSAYL